MNCKVCSAEDTFEEVNGGIVCKECGHVQEEAKLVTADFGSGQQCAEDKDNYRHSSVWSCLSTSSFSARLGTPSYERTKRKWSKECALIGSQLKCPEYIIKQATELLLSLIKNRSFSRCLKKALPACFLYVCRTNKMSVSLKMLEEKSHVPSPVINAYKMKLGKYITRNLDTCSQEERARQTLNCDMQMMGVYALRWFCSQLEDVIGSHAKEIRSRAEKLMAIVENELDSNPSADCRAHACFSLACESARFDYKCVIRPAIMKIPDMTEDRCFRALRLSREIQKILIKVATEVPWIQKDPDVSVVLSSLDAVLDAYSAMGRRSFCDDQEMQEGKADATKVRLHEPSASGKSSKKRQERMKGYLDELRSHFIDRQCKYMSENSRHSSAEAGLAIPYLNHHAQYCECSFSDELVTIRSWLRSGRREDDILTEDGPQIQLEPYCPTDYDMRENLDDDDIDGGELAKFIRKPSEVNQLRSLSISASAASDDAIGKSFS